MINRMYSKILFLDVETASGYSSYLDLPEKLQILWAKKAKKITKDNYLTETDIQILYEEKAAIYAEYNRIICISVGYLAHSRDNVCLKIKSYNNESEKDLLNDFCLLLNTHYNNLDRFSLCGHNIKEFDCPVLCRRMIINDIKLPKLLRLSRKKPWQVDHLIDTLEMWKFGDYKSYVSLDLLASVLNISSSKIDLDGSKVSKVYWYERDLERIRSYCEQDVVTTVSVFLRLVQERNFDKVNFITN